MRGQADRLVGIDHQNSPANKQRSRRSDIGYRRSCHWGHILADFLYHLLDIARIAQNMLQSLHDFRFVTDITLHHIDGIVENVIHGQCDRAMNRFDACRCRTGLLDCQQFKRIERHRHVASKNLQKL